MSSTAVAGHTYDELPVPNHGPGNLQPVKTKDVRWIEEDIANGTLTAHILWRDAVYAKGKMAFKDGVFGGHMPASLANHLYKNAIATKCLLQKYAVLFCEDGSVYERYEKGERGVQLVPPK